jgi:KDO2-lipid IV(A) lauroyltransferase
VDLPPLAKRLKRFFRYLALRLALAAIQLVPTERAGKLGEWLGALAFRVASAERGKALESLSIAFPELTVAARWTLARDCFRHLGRCAFELARARGEEGSLLARVDWAEPDRKVLQAAASRGRGVVIVTAHVGNWELFGMSMGRCGITKANTVARETSDPRVTALLDQFRAASGVRSIWRGRNGAAKELLRSLRCGEMLGILIDQDTRVQSVFVPFFGRPAATPRAAADLALRTGAAVVCGFCQRAANGRYRIWMQELTFQPSDDREADVRLLTAAMTRQIEEAIRRAPEQWVWMHRRWKTQP